MRPTTTSCRKVDLCTEVHTYIHRWDWHVCWVHRTWFWWETQPIGSWDLVDRGISDV